VPLQAEQIAITSAAPDLPPEVPNVPPRALLSMPRNGQNGARVWHARRNIEMIAGLALKYLLGKRLRLLFTSAAQRRHTGFTRWLIRRQDAVIATSAKSAGFLERASEVIHHGVDCEMFSPASDKPALRAALNLPPDGVLIGCFGRIRHQKGNDLFIEAMCRALPAHPESRALVMGRATADNQEFLAGLKTRVAEAGLTERVIFRDEVPIAQLADHFRALDIYVAPQRWEGFGLTPLEAMACGSPVVATRVGAFEELVADGETGHLVDVEDLDAITAGVEHLLSDPETRAAWSRAAQARANDRFRLEQEAEAIIAVYRRLLSADI